MIRFTSPDEQNCDRNASEKSEDFIYDKIKIQTLKYEILQNIGDYITEISDSEFKAFKCKCAGLVEHSCFRYDKK